MTSKTAPSASKIRLDVWLWRAKLYTSRTIAARTIRLGRIRLWHSPQTLGETARVFKPNTPIHIGDELIFIHGDALLHIHVQALSPPPENSAKPSALYRHCGQDHYEGYSGEETAITA